MRFKTTSGASGDLFNPEFLARIERLALRSRRNLRGGLSGEHASRRRLPAPTFSDHRAYSPGDDLRHVDWFAYARHEDLHLKLGETEQDINVTIALDCSASLDWGHGELHKGRYALRLAAMLGYLGLTSNDQTTIWPFTSKLIKPFGPMVSRARGPDMLRYLSNLNWAEQTSFTPITQAVRRSAGGMLLIISDLWTSDLEPLLRAAAPPVWQVVVLHLLHPEEIKPTLTGPVEFEDSETGQVLALELDQQTHKAYREKLVRWVRMHEQVCQRYGATYAGIRTDRPLEQSILPFLRRRGIIGL